MIPTLLWRCPLCATNDALQHERRRLRPETVRCVRCGASWRLRRMPGDGFYLRQTAGRESSPQERPLATWYDAMKATVRLEPIQDPEFAGPEVLYLASQAAELQAEETDPLFFEVADPPEPVTLNKCSVPPRPVGRGRLLLTNQQLIWRGDGCRQSFPLERLHSAYALLDYGVALLVGLRLYAVLLLHESPLKWITYLALVSAQVQQQTGHRIATSHW